MTDSKISETTTIPIMCECPDSQEIRPIWRDGLINHYVHISNNWPCKPISIIPTMFKIKMEFDETILKKPRPEITAIFVLKHKLKALAADLEGINNLIEIIEENMEAMEGLEEKLDREHETAGRG